MKLSLPNKDKAVAASYTAGSSVGVGGIALACNAPLGVVAFMSGAVIATGAIVAYVKTVDNRKETE